MNAMQRLRPLLGTFVEIGARSTDREVLSAITAAFQVIETIECLASFQNPHSELSRLNSSNKPIKLHPMMLQLLRLARKMTELSRGLFNCTVAGKLVRMGVLPNHDGTELLDYGDANDITIKGSYAQLQRPVRITLDGIAKGYAIDQAILILQHYQIEDGWINAGGDMRVFGNMQLAVQRRELDGSVIPLGNLQHSAMATSWVKNSFDPRFPGTVVAGHQGKAVHGVWTVLASQAWRADALTKVASLANPEQRERLVQILGGQLLSPRQAA